MLHAPPESPEDAPPDQPSGRGERRRAWLVAAVLVAVAVLVWAAVRDDGGEAPSTAPPSTAPPSTATTAPPAPPLWEGTFEEADWKDAFGIVQFHRAERAEVVDPPFESRGKVLRIDTPGSRDQSSVWGIDARASFEELGLDGMEEAYLRYRVWFPEDYEWVDGGKLPGLSGVVDGAPPWLSASSNENGDHDERQWSGRLMWKGGGTLISYLNVVRAGGVVHDRLRTDTGRIYSVSIPWREDGDRDGDELEFREGWNTIELHYRMNTPGRADGVHRGWLNGELGIDLDDVEYRTEDHPDLDINQISLAVFYGGPLGPRRDATSYFDDFAVGRERLSSTR